MRYIIFSISILFLYINATSQIKSNYARGFEVGFKEGYCYNNDKVDCFYPLTPLAPLPRINENKDNYTQGYNRGFQFGLDLKRSNDAANNLNYNLSIQIPSFNDYIRQNPVDAMVAVGMYKQMKYDTRKDWIQKRIDQLVDLRNALFSSATLPEGYDVYETRNLYWQSAVDYVRSLAYVDFADDYQFNAIQNNFNKIEKYLYDSYSGIMQADEMTDRQDRNVTQQSRAMGQVSFWTNWKGSGNMVVYLDGRFVGKFKSYFPNGTPNCGQDGTLTISYEEGTYSFYAKGEGAFATYTWNGTVTITAGSCTLQGLTKK